MGIWPFIIFLLFSFPLFSQPLEENKLQINEVIALEIESSINPATYEYVKNNGENLRLGQLLLIKLNTPGGLVSTTKNLLTFIGKLKVPTIIWVTPEGASATSAGAILSAGSHALFMSPGTNIGAATPIQMGKDIPKDARSKAINDLVALTRSLSEGRGRNPNLFKKMIEEASSYTAREAVKQGVAQGIVNSQKDLLEKLDGREVVLNGIPTKLSLNPSPRVETKQMSWGIQILNTFANPTTAYLLFIAGIALLYFELQAPGGFLAGAIGAICLILAGLGFQVLPLNWGALGLVGLSIVLFVLEIFITSFGLLTIAGLISLVFGSLFLYQSEDGLIEMQTSVIVATVIALACFFGIIVAMFASESKRKKRNIFSMVDKSGPVMGAKDTVICDSGMTGYQVKIEGVIWKAQSKENQLQQGDIVSVISENKQMNRLTVEKK